MCLLSLTPKLFEGISSAVGIVEKAINNIKTQVDAGRCSGAPESKLKQLVSQPTAKADTDALWANRHQGFCDYGRKVMVCTLQESAFRAVTW